MLPQLRRRLQHRQRRTHRLLPVRHRAFTLRLPTVRDNIEATDEVGSHNGVALSAAVFARQVASLGTLPPDAITFELIADMHPKDYNALEDAAARLEKKHEAVVAADSTSPESDSPLSAQA